MSPNTNLCMSQPSSGPRASGDEPRTIDFAAYVCTWSPRERG